MYWQLWSSDLQIRLRVTSLSRTEVAFISGSGVLFEWGWRLEFLVSSWSYPDADAAAAGAAADAASAAASVMYFSMYV